MSSTISQKKLHQIQSAEKVLCIKTDDFKDLFGTFQGFLPIHKALGFDVGTLPPEDFNPRAVLFGQLNTIPFYFLERNLVETDPSYKQIIPYCTFTYTQTIQQYKTFQQKFWMFNYMRDKGGEARLNSKVSVGVGGHINPPTNIPPDEYDLQTIYWNSLQRELLEEIRIGCRVKHSIVGMINDETTDVGKVHLGIVHNFTCNTMRIVPKESTLINAGFSLVSLMFQHLMTAQGMELEPWSKFVVDNFPYFFGEQNHTQIPHLYSPLEEEFTDPYPHS